MYSVHKYGVPGGSIYPCRLPQLLTDVKEQPTGLMLKA